MNTRTRLAAAFAARDPAHVRLTTAVALTLGMLASAGFAQFVIVAFHTETGLLAMAIFLSVQAGSMVKDPTPAARLVTTALLLPSVALAIGLAGVLSVHRAALITTFVLITGGATWVRRFGARASAIGSFVFIGYFFTLFMKPPVTTLPAFCLVAAGAVATQIAVRAVLMLRRPRRQLDVLLRELRAGSLAALRAASGTTSRALTQALGRLDGVGDAITTWQGGFPTMRYAGADDGTFAELVLSARVDTEEVCLNRLQHPRTDDTTAPSVRRAASALLAVLRERTPMYRIRAADDVAQDIIERPDSTFDAYLMARCIRSHAALREVVCTHAHSRSAGSTAYRGSAPLPVTASIATTFGGAASDAPHGSRRWNSWQPTTRMAAQVMIAASVACTVGESISATRWYWAVMTAFVIFIGSTTRGAILTRAYRRVVGTVLGIGIGVAAVALTGDQTAILIAICGVGVFGMLYFGPLDYLYSVVFMTTMLVSLYRMLGVLDGSLLEVRLAETLSGAAVGVLCAYLILSTSSRPTLIAKVDAYLDAVKDLLDSLLSKVEDPAVSAEGGQVAGLPAIVRGLHKLESAQAGVDEVTSAMSIAFVSESPRQEREAVHLMSITTRAAARLVQIAVESPASAGPSFMDDAGVRRGVDDVGRSVESARAVLHGEKASAPPDSPDPGPAFSAGGHDPSDDSRARDAVVALTRMDRALQRFVTHR